MQTCSFCKKSFKKCCSWFCCWRKEKKYL